MRRIYNPLHYDFLQPMQGINTFISVNGIVSGCVADLLCHQFHLVAVCWPAGEQSPGKPIRWSGQRHRPRHTAILSPPR